MLIVDWLMWQLLLDRKLLDSEKNTLGDKFTTPNIDNFYIHTTALIVFKFET